jgi:O-antigen/teichoic acid export membrane protein
VAFVFAGLGGGLLALTIASIAEYGFRRPELRPSLAGASARQTRELLSHGVSFFAMQLAITAIYASDNIIIARVIGPQAVASYSVAGRLFFVSPLVLLTFLTPLWPAYADAISRGDVVWIRKTMYRSVALSLGTCTVIGGATVLLGPWLLRIWVGTSIDASPWLLTGMALWGISSSMGTALSMVLNGLQVLRFQAIAAVATAVASIGFKTWAAQRWGVVAIPWTQVAVHAMTVVIPSAIVVRRAIRRMG